jgi:predicted permease
VADELPADRTRGWKRWFSTRSGRRGLAEDVRDELETHVAMGIEHLRRQGHSPAEAERLARARFGVFSEAERRLVASARRRNHAMHRQQRFEDLRRDLRSAARQAVRAPWFHAAAILTLAVGIGANGAVFSILRAALLEPLPYDDPARVYMIWRRPERLPAGESSRIQSLLLRGGLTPTHVLGWREASSDVFTDVAAIQSSPGSLEAQFDLALSDRAERLRGALVTPNFFDILGSSVQLGRTFTAGDESSGEPLLVLSHALWERAFGADSTVIGRPLTLIGGRPRGPRTYTILGVLPPAFRFSYPQEIEAWAMLPWSDVRLMSPRSLSFNGVGRLRRDRTPQQADAHIARFRDPFEEPGMPPERRQVMRLEPIRDWVVGETRPSLYLLAGVALLLLVMTCVTVANGLLARVSERQRELTVRASLGAGRGRLVRQLLTEGGALALAGTLAGTLLALGLQPILRQLLPPSVPRVGDFGVDASVVGFAAAIAAICTVLAGMAPAWNGSRPDVTSRSLRIATGSSASRGAVRWRQGLVGFQAAIATTLLIGAGLLLASLWRLGRVPLGFDGRNVLTVEMRLLGSRYRPRVARAAFQQQLIERVRALPGVSEAGLTSAVPFRGVDFYLTPDGPNPERRYSGNGRYVDPGYFSVLRIPLRRGRLLSEDDREGGPRVVVVSESYVAKAFPGEDPIGQTLDMEMEGPVTIVGVVGDVRYSRLDEGASPALYIPRAQSPSELICLVARITVPVASITRAIHRTVQEIDPSLPAMQLTTVDRIIGESIANRRFYTVATASFASLALLLTVAGLAVVVARVVVERRKEFAIRSALGAGGARLVSEAARSGLLPVIVGIGAGILAAWAGSVLLAQFLFEIAPRSAASYGAVATLVLVVAIVSATLPATRLLRLPLTTILRTD